MGFKLKPLLQKIIKPVFRENEVHFNAQNDIQIQGNSEIVVGSSFSLEDMPDGHVLQISTPQQMIDIGIISPTQHMFKSDLKREIFHTIYNLTKSKIVIPVGRKIMKCILKKVADDLPELLLMGGQQINQKCTKTKKIKKL